MIEILLYIRSHNQRMSDSVFGDRLNECLGRLNTARVSLAVYQLLNREDVIIV
jgi:hypothetical protein